MKAHEYLDEKGIDYTLVEQENPTKSCDDAARERGVETRQIVKSLIVERDGEKFHCLVPGDRELSAGKFGEHAMVPPEKSREITGLESGTVHPFSTDLKHFIDETLLEEPVLSHTVGETRRGIIIETEEFISALEQSGFEYDVRDIIESGERELKELIDEGFEEREAKFVLNNGLRRTALKLSEDYPAGLVSTALQELSRKKLDLGRSEDLLERAEGENHIKKMVESLEETGEIPEDTDFELEEVIEQVLDENQNAVEDYNSGKDSAKNYLVGRVMKQTNGRADSSRAVKLLESGLDD